MSADGHHAGLPYHVDLLSDPWRANAWKRAIEAVIRPGDTVLDVGTGTGIMAVWAARAGAARVIAIECSDAADIAAQTVARNGVSDRVQVVRADLATLPAEPVDVILCDYVGRLLPDAAMARAVGAARAWAGPATRWAPGRIRILAAPVAEIAHPALDRLEIPLLGVDLGAAAERAWRVPWTAVLSPEALLVAPTELASWHTPDVPATLTMEHRWTLPNPGRLRGVALWFEAALAPDVSLDTGPGRRTFWGQILWAGPLTTVQSGDEVVLNGTVATAVDHIPMSWRLAVHRDGVPVPDDADHDRAVWSGTEPRSLGEALLAGGRPGPAIAPLMHSRATDDAEGSSLLIMALASVGDPAAWQLLAEYERRHGPHPTLRRG